MNSNHFWTGVPILLFTAIVLIGVCESEQSTRNRSSRGQPERIIPEARWDLGAPRTGNPCPDADTVNYHGTNRRGVERVTCIFHCANYRDASGRQHSRAYVSIHLEHGASRYADWVRDRDYVSGGMCR